MGEIADMILEGEMCACGAMLRGPASGHPRYCDKKCAQLYAPNNKPGKVRCPQCKKSVKESGLKDHIRMVHEPHPPTPNSLNALKEKFS